MADVSVNFDEHGDFLQNLEQEKSKLSGFLRIPVQVPDPKEWLTQQRQQVRPWLVFIQTSNFKSPPTSLPRLGKRVMKNIEYFQANYVFVFLGLVLYCLITSPLILFALAGTFYAGYRLNKRQLEKKFVLFGKELSIAQQYGLLVLCSLPIYYLVGAHGAMFWVIGASVIIITIHAAFYNIDTLVEKGDDNKLLLEV